MHVREKDRDEPHDCHHFGHQLWLLQDLRRVIIGIYFVKALLQSEHL